MAGSLSRFSAALLPWFADGFRNGLARGGSPNRWWGRPRTVSPAEIACRGTRWSEAHQERYLDELVFHWDHRPASARPMESGIGSPEPPLIILWMQQIFSNADGRRLTITERPAASPRTDTRCSVGSVDLLRLRYLRTAKMPKRLARPRSALTGAAPVRPHPAPLRRADLLTDRGSRSSARCSAGRCSSMR